MKERIRELAEQEAGAILMDLIMPDAGMPERIKWNVGCTIEHLKQFAELIVLECVQTLIDNTPERYTNEVAEEDWDKGYDRAMKDCVHLIQKHFGVKE